MSLKVRAGSVHALLADNLGNIQRRDKKKSRNMFGRSSRQDQARKAAEQAASFFFNYNTVEAVLLCCAVLVNLSGIMVSAALWPCVVCRVACDACV